MTLRTVEKYNVNTFFLHLYIKLFFFKTSIYFKHSLLSILIFENCPIDTNYYQLEYWDNWSADQMGL